MTPILEVTHVDQSFRTGFWLKRAQILHDVHFTVSEKSIFGFLGTNGAGKTTLIHLMVGLRKPFKGEVKLFGCDATSVQARARIGYLPERPYFHQHLKGEEILQFYGALSGMSRSQVQARIDKVLASVGMTHARKIELKKYSKGMLQRIGIAQALIHDPEFLVLDEPMSGLDPLGRKEMRELIVQLASEGRTILFSSHVIPDVEAICDQVALIQKGRLVGCGPIGSFLAKGAAQVEIGFGGLKIKDKVSSELSALFDSLREIQDGMRGVVSSQEKVNEAIEKLLQKDAKILWVTPIRPSLESLFL